MGLLIPSYQYTEAVREDKTFSDSWQQIMDQLLRELQTNLSDNGWSWPQRTAAQITTLATMMPNGTVWYDTTNNLFKGLQGGVVRTFTTV